MDAFWKSYLLGGVNGALARTITAPLNYTKLAIQVQDLDPRVRRGEIPRHGGFIDCFLRIYREEGFLAFYRGHLQGCLRYFPTQAFNLVTKDTFKKLFPKYNPKTQYLGFFTANLLSGSLAAVCSLAIVYPFDYVINGSTVDAIQGRKPREASYYLKRIVAKGGITALWTGIGVSLVGIIVYRGFQLAAFDKMTGLNPWKKDKGWLGALSTFVAAQTAILTGAVFTYPLDTIRRLLQWQHLYDDSESPIYEGPIDCFKKIMDVEGLAGFYKGFGASCIASITGALAMTGYARTRRHMGI